MKIVLQETQNGEVREVRSIELAINDEENIRAHKTWPDVISVDGDFFALEEWDGSVCAYYMRTYGMIICTPTPSIVS